MELPQEYLDIRQVETLIKKKKKLPPNVIQPLECRTMKRNDCEMETYGDFWVRLEIFYLLEEKKLKKKKKLKNEDDMTVTMVITENKKVDYPPPFPANLKEKGRMEI